MLTFASLIVARWLGYACPGLSEAEALKLWDIIQLGIGGYVIGRSTEKILPQVAEAMRRCDPLQFATRQKIAQELRRYNRPYVSSASSSPCLNSPISLKRTD
jgi:hypothetical protein